MTDKTIPTNIWAGTNCGEHGAWWDCELQETQLYTRIHDNPDYHVIKKSDVDGDVMGALEYLDGIQIMLSETHEDPYSYIGSIKAIRNALIAQSDPDIVRIPRKVLEGMLKVHPSCLDSRNREQTLQAMAHNQAINDVLNYKEGDDENCNT